MHSIMRIPNSAVRYETGHRAVKTRWGRGAIARWRSRSSERRVCSCHSETGWSAAESSCKSSCVWVIYRVAHIQGGLKVPFKKHPTDHFISHQPIDCPTAADDNDRRRRRHNRVADETIEKCRLADEISGLIDVADNVMTAHQIIEYRYKLCLQKKTRNHLRRRWQTNRQQCRYGREEEYGIKCTRWSK